MFSYSFLFLLYMCNKNLIYFKLTMLIFKISLLNYSFMYMFKDHVVSYPGFSTFNYFWNFGFLAFLCLMAQLMTGLVASMYYSADMNLAFFSIEHFMSDFQYGWIMSYFHFNGASLFFFLIYFHMFSGIFYKSYNKIMLWLSGFVIFLLLFLTTFIGYILPWGQMSYWGCMVITSLFTAMPVAGEFILNWMWGGTKISEITLVSLYSFHFMLPFIMLALSFLHVAMLHMEGGSSPLGMENYDYMNFYPYLVVKDFFSFFLFSLGFYMYFMFFNPNKLGDSLNYIMADNSKTPLHIVPEWYFLPYYGMLSCIYNKVIGILLFLFSLICIGLLAFFPISKMPVKFDIIHKVLFFLLVVTFMNLGWLAMQLMSDFVIFHSSIWTIVYFFLYLLFFLNNIMEKQMFDETKWMKIFSMKKKPLCIYLKKGGGFYKKSDKGGYTLMKEKDLKNYSKPDMNDKKNKFY